MFLTGETFQGIKCSEDFPKLGVVAYLSDIFTYFNGLNLNAHGSALILFRIEGKGDAVIMILDFGSECLRNGAFESFPIHVIFLQHLWQPLLMNNKHCHSTNVDFEE